MKNGFRIVQMKNGKVTKDFAMELYKQIAGNNMLPLVTTIIAIMSRTNQQEIHSRQLPYKRVARNVHVIVKELLGNIIILYPTGALFINCSTTCDSPT